jgi:hypothetical protein
MISKENEMDGTCSTHMEDEKCKQYFSQKTRMEETIGRYRRRWEYNIKVDLREILCDVGSDGSR